MEEEFYNKLIDLKLIFRFQELIHLQVEEMWLMNHYHISTLLFGFGSRISNIRLRYQTNSVIASVLKILKNFF